MPEEIDYKRLYEDEKKKVSVLEQKLQAFEMPGKAKLFYSLNKQQNDLADLLNSVNIKNIELDKATDKTMDRLKIIWASIGTLAPLVDQLQTTAGLTGNEKTDMDNRVPFIETVATKRD